MKKMLYLTAFAALALGSISAADAAPRNRTGYTHFRSQMERQAENRQQSAAQQNQNVAQAGQSGERAVTVGLFSGAGDKGHANDHLHFFNNSQGRRAN